MKPDGADDYWLERVRAGDGAALEVLFRRHVARVHGFAYSLLRNREEAEEVAADAFLRVLRSPPEVRGEGSFSSWLLRVARNLCLDRLKRPRLLTLPLDEAAEGGRWAGLLAPADQMDHTALRLQLEQALDRLPPDYRVALALRDMQGLTAAESALVTGKSEPAFRSLHQRARRALRDALRQLDDEELAS